MWLIKDLMEVRRIHSLVHAFSHDIPILAIMAAYITVLVVYLCKKNKISSFYNVMGLKLSILDMTRLFTKKKNKEARNLTLLEAAVREEPEVDRYRYYLGREYLILRRLEEAKQMLASVFKLSEIDPMCYRETQVAYLQCLYNMNSSFEELLTRAISILEETPNEANAWYLLSLIYERFGHREDSVDALEQALKYVDDVEVNMQTSQLQAERAKAEVILAQHYSKQEHRENESKDWYYKAWSHLSIQDDGWTDLVTHILKWTISTEEIDLQRQVLKSMAENLHSLRLQQAFIVGLRALSTLDSKRHAMKLLKLAIKAQVNLRIDPSFVQLLRELKS